MIQLVTYFLFTNKKRKNLKNFFIFPSNMNNTYKVRSYEQKAPYRI